MGNFPKFGAFQLQVKQRLKPQTWEMGKSSTPTSPCPSCQSCHVHCNLTPSHLAPLPWLPNYPLILLRANYSF